MRKYGRSNLSPDGPPALTAKHKLLIEYMTQGCNHPLLLKRLVRPAVLDPETGEVLKPERQLQAGQPLTIVEAARLVGMTARTARMLLASPIGSKAMAKAVADLRTGAQAKAMNRIIDLIDEPGEGKAADRKVQLEASRDILGLKDGSGVSVTINNTNNSQTITAGYAFDLTPKQQGQTIEEQATEVSE